jgi:DNA polymerase alpha subunit A
MEIDGVFKTLLLLKKKKYAFLKYEPPFDNNSALTAEYKGLDLVRRDWCDISKQAGLHILDIILSDRTKEEIVNLIFDFLKILGQKMDRDEFPISDYEIIKQLTKNVDDYADAKALPHVKVAKRLKEKGDLTIKANAHIPYVVCLDAVQTNSDDNSTHINNSKSLADRCYHPREISENTNLKLDLKWYKENQIISSVSRLCKHIEEIDMFQLANCLGIDASKYNYSMNKNKENESQHEVRMENNSLVKCFAKEGIMVTCPSCKKEKKINKIVNDHSHIQNLLKCPDVIDY